MIEMYVTATSFDKYYGDKPFGIGNIICCKKRKKCIECLLPNIGAVGVLANTKCKAVEGTNATDDFFDVLPDKFYARVYFKTKNKAICRVLDENYDDVAAAMYMLSD